MTTGPKTGATLYAFTNEYLTGRFSFEGLLREIAKRGLGPGVEVVGFQSIRSFPDVDDAFVERFKALVGELALQPTSLAINSDRFLKPGQPISDAALIDYHKRQMRAAVKLGFPLVRYQFSTPPHIVRELAPFAEDLGLKMGLEVHAPAYADHPMVIAYREVYDELDSPALGWIPDFGGTAERLPASLLNAARERGVPEGLIDLLLAIWPEKGPPPERVGRLREYALRGGYDPAHIQIVSLPFFILSNEDPKSWAALVDRTIHIHGKFYGVGDDGREEAIDYETILPLFRDGGFNGSMASEWEGHAYCVADAFDQVARHQAMCNRILERDDNEVTA
ncbi:sugar phosphate isomerase/epimerase [Sphingomonas sp.]|uniref:sugar phosphate isomerase/epimerase family protein n=1 Tax=Sphingomonas sp. TaxID=28214 RepID=UPI001EBADB7B|nr:sugar phosphate isomerase/epimerase [Sphingomonas sp.]MBX3592850.1 sugar phosphate isomerase/epimerase [Sphingomonas sp.]